jgi:Tol biopolymer transport system component
MGDQPGYKYPFGWADWHSILFVNSLDNEVSDDPYVYSEIGVYDTETGQAEVLAGIRSDANESQFGVPVLSPDRTRFAYTLTSYQAGTTDVVIYDLAARSETSFTIDLPGGIAWAPDGRNLLLTAALGYTCEIHLVSLDGSEDRLLYSTDSGGGCQSTWSPDGAYLLVAETARTPTVPRLTIVDVATGEARTVELPDVGVAFERPLAVWLP